MLKMKNNSLKIKFVGKRLGRQPLESFTDGNRLITLPETQTRAFTHPDARAILQHAPDLYKKVLPARRKVVRSTTSGRFVKPEQALTDKAGTVTETV